MFGYKTQKCLYRKEKKINAEGKLKREEEFNREIPGMYLPKDFELVAMWTGTLHRSSPSAKVDRKRLFLRFIVDVQKKEDVDSVRFVGQRHNKKNKQRALRPEDSAVLKQKNHNRKKS